jgi:hypothetical protein
MRANLVQRIFKRVYGRPSWRVRKGVGSSITFEFGKPSLKVLGKVLQPNKKTGRKYPRRMAHMRADWHLWIYCCDWEIRQDGRRICHSESADKRIEQACTILDGQILTKVTVTPRTLQTDFHFDLGGHLRTTPYQGKPMEMWNIRCPNGRYFCIRADGKYTYEPGNTPFHSKRWLPLSL